MRLSDASEFEQEVVRGSDVQRSEKFAGTHGGDGEQRRVYGDGGDAINRGGHMPAGLIYLDRVNDAVVAQVLL
jgi:hypothetical protein